MLLTAIGALAVPGSRRFWQKLGPQPEVALDRAMRARTIDTLALKLNEHYVFPDKAKQIDAVLHQRQRVGGYDGIRNGYKLAQQLTIDIRGVARDLHMQVRFAPGLALPDEADGPAPTSQAQWEQRHNVVMRLFI